MRLHDMHLMVLIWNLKHRRLGNLATGLFAFRFTLHAVCFVPSFEDLRCLMLDIREQNGFIHLLTLVVILYAHSLLRQFDYPLRLPLRVDVMHHLDCAVLWFSSCFLLLLLEYLLLLHLVMHKLLIVKELLLCEKEVVV